MDRRTINLSIVGSQVARSGADDGKNSNHDGEEDLPEKHSVKTAMPMNWNANLQSVSRKPWFFLVGIDEIEWWLNVADHCLYIRRRKLFHFESWSTFSPPASLNPIFSPFYPARSTITSVESTKRRPFTSLSRHILYYSTVSLFKWKLSSITYWGI